MVTKTYRDMHIEKAVIDKAKEHIQNQKHLQSLSCFQVFYISVKIKLEL